MTTSAPPVTSLSGQRSVWHTLCIEEALQKQGADQAAGLSRAEAVIDKDRAGALLAQELGADAYLMLTDMKAVYINGGKPDARTIRRTSPEAMEAYDFAAGSMGPKGEATCDFVRKTGGMAGIDSLQDAPAMLQGKAGATFAPHVNGIEWYEQAAVEGKLRKEIRILMMKVHRFHIYELIFMFAWSLS